MGSIRQDAGVKPGEELAAPLSVRDVRILVGILAAVEGFVRLAEGDGHLARKMRSQLESSGYTAADATDEEVAQELHGLGQRLRRALGEKVYPQRSD
ncbi:MAG TPA: hypothetical protein VLB29_19400 [Nocardioidaceae bacterium]|nr:hypothetical protein [Nocardioidaceae bacterium]